MNENKIKFNYIFIMSILTLYKSNSRSALSKDRNEGPSTTTPMKLIKS